MKRVCKEKKVITKQTVQKCGKHIFNWPNRVVAIGIIEAHTRKFHTIKSDKTQHRDDIN